MQSTDHNLNNPTSVNEIDIQLTNIQRVHDVVEISQENYHLITKDPDTVYAVTDHLGNCQMYLGEMIIHDEMEYPRYVLGPETNSEYTILAVYRWKSLYWMVPIKRYKDAMCAVRELNRLNNSGCRRNADTVHNILISCLRGNITMNDLIVSVITGLGYNDASLASLIAIVNDDVYSHDRTTVNGIRMISSKLMSDLPRLAYEHPTSMFPKYNAICNVLIKHNIFWNKKFTENPETADLHEVIDDIIDAADKF